MDAKNAPYSINKPEGWDEIRAYSEGKGKPSKELAEKAFDELIENIKLENCVYFPDVVNAIFRRVPGKVEAENYGHEGPNKSYFVRDVGRKAKHYRTSEPVAVEVIEGQNGKRWTSEQYIKLGEGEWTSYEINSRKTQTYRAVVRAKAEGAASFVFSLNGQSKEINITDADWVEMKLDEVEFSEGTNRFKIAVSSGRVYFDWFDFE
jgi:hypothetical protein